MSVELPPGWVMAPLARDRLVHQAGRLTGAAAVVAAPVPLPPGASYLSLAEHLALLPLDALHRVDEPADGSVARVAVERAGWTGAVVDSGAACHDPETVDPTLAPASPLGRSPFPRRPTALLVALDDGEEHLDRARRTTNALVERGIEARLAVHRFPPGRHLTRPCLAEPAALTTLQPDCLVALDPAALAVALEWCAPVRRTAVVDATATAGTADLDLRRGRLRASIGADLDPDILAGLVRRLAVGPQPGPPPDATLPPPVLRRPPARTARPATLVRVALCAGVLDHDGRARWEALADALRASGHEVHLRDRPDDTADHHLLVCAGLAADPTLLAVVERRREAGRATVVDLTPDDLAPGAPDGPLGLAPHVRDLVEVAGRVTSTSEAWCQELAHQGLDGFHLPSPAGDLATVAVTPEGEALGRMGWVTTGGPLDPVLATAVAELLARHPALTARIWADARWWPEALDGHPQATLHAGLPAPQDLVGAAAVLWAPDPRRSEAAGPPAWFTGAAFSGACPLLPAPAGASLQALLPPALLVDPPAEPGAWVAAVTSLLDDATTFRRLRHEVRRRAAGRHGQGADRRRATDLVAWATGPRSAS